MKELLFALIFSFWIISKIGSEKKNNIKNMLFEQMKIREKLKKDVSTFLTNKKKYEK